MIYSAMLYDALIAPFTEFEFMRRALAAVIALALGGAPIGVFLMLRRMSLVGDAMAHAILPGAAIGFLLSGLNLFAMTTGGLIAGFTVAILAGVVARTTELKEDASLATFYLVSLALGVTIVSIKGTNIDLLHVLFGNILAMDDPTLLVIAFNTTITLLVLAVIYRPLVIECVDPVFLRTVSRAGAPAHLAFLALVVVNLVNGFQALGTLLAVGLMILPAGIARFWSRDITGMICIAVASAMAVGLCGAGAVVSNPGAVGACDHSGGGGAVHCLGAVRQRQRPGQAAVSRPPPRSVADNRMRCFQLWLICLALLASAPAVRAQDRLNVVASFSILGDFVRNVGGDRVSVTTLVGPERRRARLYAGAGRRAEDRRCQARDRQRPRPRGLAAAAGAILRQQGRDRDRDRRHRAARNRRGRRSACLAVGGRRQDLCRQYPRRAGRRRPRGRRGFSRQCGKTIWRNSMRWTVRCARRSRKSRRRAAR